MVARRRLCRVLLAALGSIKFHHSITQELARIVQCAYRKAELQVTISVTKKFQSVGIILKKIRAKNADLLLSGTGPGDDPGNRSWLDRKFHSVLLRKGLRELQNLVRLVLIGFGRGLGKQPRQCTCRIAYQGGVYCQIANSGTGKLEFKIAEHTLTNRDQRACTRFLRLGQCGNFAQSIVLKFHVNAKSFKGSPILPDHATFRSLQNRKVVIRIELLTDYAYRKPTGKFRL